MDDKKKLEEIAKQQLVIDDANDLGLTEAQRFVRTFNIKPGSVKVPNMLIYHTYVQWRGEKHQAKLDFFRQFKALGFEPAVKKKDYMIEYCYKLDGVSIQVNRDNIDAARKYHYNEILKKKRKEKNVRNLNSKKTKKQSSESGSE